jgi:Bacterial Ig domain
VTAPRIRGIPPILALVAFLACLAPAAARAEPNTCPTTRTDAAQVTIDSPASDTDVSGTVEVKGRVESSTELFQVELFVGDSRRDVIYVDPPSSALDFTLRWDTTGTKAGPTTARIVACGGSPDGLSLIQGTASVPVKVQSSPAESENKALVATESADIDAPSPSLVMGLVIAVPAVAGLFYAASGRRRRM